MSILLWSEGLPWRTFRGNALGSMGLLYEYGDAQIVVHLLAAPAGDGGLFVDADVLLGVVFHQLAPVGQGTGVVGGDAVEALAVGLAVVRGAGGR